MKQTLCEQKVSDLRSVLFEKREEMEVFYTCIENLTQGRDSVILFLLKPLELHEKSIANGEGKLSLSEQARIYRLNRLVEILKQIAAILEHFLVWAASKSDVISGDLLNEMFIRVNKKVLVLHKYWTDDKLTIDVSDAIVVECHIAKLHTQIEDILNSMMTNTVQLQQMGVIPHRNNEYTNGHGIFDHHQQLDDDNSRGSLSYAALGYGGQNLFKTEVVDMDYYNSKDTSDDVELFSSSFIQMILYQMPKKYTATVC